MTKEFELDLSMPGTNWSWQQLQDASRAWGAPEELLPFLYWQRDRFAARPAPIVSLNNAYLNETIGSAPFGLVIEVLKAGAGLDLELTKPFDLESLGDAVHTLTSFDVSGDQPALLKNAELISEMRSARAVSLMVGLGRVDMSGLTAMRTVQIWDADQLSALEAPDLVSVNLRIGRLPRGLTLPPQLASIGIWAKHADLTTLGEFDELREIYTYGVEDVDLAFVANATHLDTVTLLHAKSVTNLAALVHKPLEMLAIEGAREITHAARLFDITARQAHLKGSAFDVELASQLSARNGWIVTPTRPPTPRMTNLFEIQERDTDVELVLTDFGWVADQLGVSNVDLTSETVERLAQLAILAEHTHPDLVLDSESDGVHLIVSSPELARAYSKAIDQFFGNRRKLRAAYRESTLP